MAQLIVLKGGSNETFDLTRYIPMGSYQINNITNYDEWTDSNYTVHRRKTSEKAQGDITVVFPDISTYEAFVTFISTYKNATTGAIACDVFVTNENRVKSINAFIDFEPQNDLPYLNEKKSDGFTISIMES